MPLATGYALGSDPGNTLVSDPGYALGFKPAWLCPWL
jgi:hypothetical protein